MVAALIALAIAVTLGVSTVALLVLGLVLRNRQRNVWIRYASARGLQMSSWGLTDELMQGYFNGVRVTIARAHHDHGRSSHDTTQWIAEIPAAMPQGMELTSESEIPAVHRWLGSEDIQVGDPDLDRVVHILGTDTPNIRALVTHSSLRPELLRFATTQWRFRINTRVMAETMGVVTDYAALDRGVAEVVHLAQTLAAAASHLCAVPSPVPASPRNVAPNAPGIAGVDVVAAANVVGHAGGGFRSPPAPVYQPQPAPTLIERIAAAGQTAETRAQILQQAAGQILVFACVTERVDPAGRADLPENWRNGCVLRATVGNGIRLAVAYAPAYMPHIVGLPMGHVLRLQAAPHAWEESTNTLWLLAL